MTKFVPKEVLGDSTFVAVYDPESGDTGYVRMGDLVGKSESTVTATAGPGVGTGITQIVALTQAQYDALVTKDAATLYVIVEG